MLFYSGKDKSQPQVLAILDVYLIIQWLATCSQVRGTYCFKIRPPAKILEKDFVRVGGLKS